MRSWVLVFLMALVMSASLVPCCPQDNCADEIAVAQDHAGEESDAGACSPFFTCGTCVGFAELVRTFSLPHYQAIAHVHHASIYHDQLSAHISSFFQPPRSV